MSYTDIAIMATSPSLIGRATAAAAEQGITEPGNWVARNIWRIVAQPGWDEAWNYAEGTKTINVNQDTGARDDVINDGMILAAVQALNTPEPVEEPVL